jgi:uncharacterized protein
LQALNLSRQTRLAARVRVADTFLSRLIGLLGQRSLDKDDGLWIKPCRSIHTVGMMFSLDAVFLDARNRVIKTRSELAPFRICRGGRTVKSVLELAAGTIEHTHTAPGDQIRFVEDA